MFRPRRGSAKGLSINHMIPNALTLLALCAGLTAIRYAFLGRWQAAVVAIVLAAVLDGLDGRIARLLQGTSKFGAELDSLSDFVSFGVAPAIMMYLWVLHDAGGIGWAIVLLFPICASLRLARFNTALGQGEMPSWAYNFFTGVPTPAGAGLLMVPMMLSFEIGRGWVDSAFVVGALMVVVALLEVSRIPTFSFKKYRVPAKAVLPSMIGIGIFAAFLVTEPWLTLVTVGVVYMISIPFSIASFGRLSRQAEELKGAVPTDGDDRP